MPRRELARIEERVRAHRPARFEGEPAARAAVAIVLAPADRDLDVLLIERAKRARDPWSGHMAFPGGRRDRSDPDLVTTAVRETREEVGIDLSRHGRLLGPLDELQALAGGHPLDLVITPFLFGLEHPLGPAIDPREVAAALWVPLGRFRDGRSRATTSFARGGVRAELPAFRIEGHTVWGLTYRMIERLLEVIGDDPRAGRGGA